MSMGVDLLLVLRIVVVAISLGAAGAGFYAGWRWRHAPRRFLFGTLGAVACALSAGLAMGGLFGAPAPGGLPGWLRLLPDIMLPVLLIAFLAGVRRQDAQRRAAVSAAPINPATGLPNRPALVGQILPALARSRREGAACSVIAAALDGTAAVEEQHGPGAAAELLRDFATAFREATRAGDVTGHVRAQVLGALAIGADADAARVLGERLREEISVRLPHPAMDGRNMTVSVGVSLIGGGPATAALDEAFAASEAALAAARRAGGNRVVVAEPPPLRSAGSQ